MMRGADRANRSNLWEVSATESFAAPPLTGRVDADAVVVGGGFTGCAAALHLVEAGLTTRLVEAATIGHGGSGRNVGLVNAGLWLPPDDVETVVGREAGQRLNDVLAGGPAYVFELIARHAIACAAVRRGTLHCAHSPAGAAELARRQRQLAARGVPVTLLDATAAAHATGAATLHGALLDPRAGTIQPLAYVRGLARAAQARGAHLHEGTPATAIAHDGVAWTVTCPQGSLRARTLLLAVNAYATPTRAPWRPRYTAMHYFQLATPPLAATTLGTILPQHQGAWDTAAVMTSFRLDDEGRLVLGAIGALGGWGERAHRAWAMRKVRALFPQLGDVAFEHAWFGRIAVTPDRIPRIQRLGPMGYSIFGYNGRGIAPGTLLGRAFAEVAATGDERAFPLAPVDAVHASLASPVLELAYDAGAIAAHLIDAR
jgi:glycine/D-amino acid oxidase-like deaminating enzyme